LGPEIFGVVATAASIIQLFDAFIEYRLSNEIITSKSLDDNLCSAIFWYQSSVGLAIGAVIFLFSGWLGSLYGDSRLEHVLRFMCICVFVNSLGCVQDAIIRKTLRFRLLTIRNVTTNIISGGVGIIMVYAGLGIDGMVAMLVLSSVIGSGYLWVTSTWRPNRFHWKSGLWRSLKSSTYLAASSISASLILQANLFLVGMFYGAASSGLYSFSVRIYDVLMRITTFSVSEAAFPVLSESLDDPRKYRSDFLSMLRVGSVPAVGILVFGGITCSAFVPLLFGAKWEGAVPYLQFLLLTGALITYGALNDVVIISHKRNRVIALTQLYGFLLFAWQISNMNGTSPLLPIYIWVFKELTIYPFKSFLANKLIGLKSQDYIVLVLPVTIACSVMTAICELIKIYCGDRLYVSSALLMTFGLPSFFITFKLANLIIQRNIPSNTNR
jgi:PST family polysaccharide transporter